MTLAELRAAREKAGAALTALSRESQAEGFATSPEWETKWAEANATYNAAVTAEEAEATRMTRASTADQVAADAARLNAAGLRPFRPDYTPTAATNTPSFVPATAHRHGPIRAFKGAHAVQLAERAGMWAAAALYGNSQAAQWCQANGVQLVSGTLDSGPMAVLNTFDNKGAGYFIPNEIEYAIQELALVYGVFRQFAEVVPMGSGTKSTPRWTGSMTAYWIAEGAKPTSSDPAWDLVTLSAKNLGAMTKLTRQLDEDSVVALGDKITMCLAEAFTYAEDNAGFNGDATSTYGGITGLITKILAASAAYADAISGNVSPATLDLDDFNAVVAKYPNYPNAQPRWFMHKAVWANAVQRLQLAAAGVTPADYATGGGPTLLGYPVSFVNVMDSTPGVSEIAAIFGDLRLSSKIGDRRGRTVEMGFENDDFTKQLITILGTQRVDIVNHTITDPRSASNPGPVVGLKLAAS